MLLDSFNVNSEWILQTQTHVPVRPVYCSIRLTGDSVEALNAIKLCFNRGERLEIGRKGNVVYVQDQRKFNFVDVTTCSIEQIVSTALSIYPSSVDFANLNLDLGVLADLTVSIWFYYCRVERNGCDEEDLRKVFGILDFHNEKVTVDINRGEFDISTIKKGRCFSPLINLKDWDVCSAFDLPCRAIKSPVCPFLNEVSVNSELLCQHSGIIKYIYVESATFVNGPGKCSIAELSQSLPGLFFGNRHLSVRVSNEYTLVCELLKFIG